MEELTKIHSYLNLTQLRFKILSLSHTDYIPSVGGHIQLAATTQDGTNISIFREVTF